MERLLDLVSRQSGASDEEFAQLRRGLLLLDREATRTKGKRKLSRLIERGNPVVVPFALSGMAACAFWENDFMSALYWLRQTISRYPACPVALWCSTLLVSVYRTLGMRREKFEAEGERFRLMKKIAFQGESPSDRIFALYELLQELRARDRHADAEKCEEELRELISSHGRQLTWAEVVTN